MRLRDLNPRWACDADIVIGGIKQHFEGRTGMAVSFDCPHCRVIRLAVWFGNPIDGLPPTDDATHLWQRSGETFDALTLTPSIDASKEGHWHGFITAGEIQ
jgi:hypothetical protein